MKRFLNWLWKWMKRAILAMLAVVGVLYLIVLVRSLTPVTVEDDDLQIETLSELLDPPPTPSNAFEGLGAASEKLWWPEEENNHFQSGLLSLTNWDQALAAEVLQKNQPTLAVLAKVDKFPQLIVPSVVLGEELTYLKDWKKISSLLTVQERSLYQSGQVEESFESMFRHLRLCQQMADAHGPLIVYMVGCGNSARVLETISQSLTATNLSPVSLKKYIEELGSMSSNAAPVFVNAIKAEYKCNARAIDDMREGKYIDPELGQVFFQPRWWWPVLNASKTKALLVGNSHELIRSASSHYKDLDIPKLNFRPGLISWVLSGNAAGQVMAFLVIPSTTATFTTKCNSKIRLNATRTMMALRAYQLTHEKLPEKLADLVPEFLGQVPVDDYDGQPLRYSPTDKIVYSVGKNLKDDGGDDRGQEEWNSQERHLDTVFRFDF